MKTGQPRCELPACWLGSRAVPVQLPLHNGKYEGLPALLSACTHAQKSHLRCLAAGQPEDHGSIVAACNGRNQTRLSSRRQLWRDSCMVSCMERQPKDHGAVVATCNGQFDDNREAGNSWSSTKPGCKLAYEGGGSWRHKRSVVAATWSRHGHHCASQQPTNCMSRTAAKPQQQPTHAAPT